MTISSIGRLASAAAVAAAVTGCVSAPQPLYYWGNYQPAVYGYLKRDESPEGQLAKLEETAAQAQSKGMALPPGFMAQMGLLYIGTGQGSKAQVAFQTEQVRFPESKVYMDFLLKKPPSLLPAKAPAPIIAPAKPAGAAAKPAAKPAAAPVQKGAAK